jgi:hypothetical protein
MCDGRGGGTGRGRVWSALALLLALMSLLPPAMGCARRPRPPVRRQALPLAVQVYADTGRTGRLEVRPPAARVWVARVTPTRASLRQLPAPPEAAPESLPPFDGATDALEVDAGLKPPLLRTPVRLLLPPGRTAATWVDLDVRVDETGAVSEALWMAGSEDTSLVEAARRCALSMRFYPALRAGRAVAVWCRQRFDFRSAARRPAGR